MFDGLSPFMNVSCRLTGFNGSRDVAREDARGRYVEFNSTRTTLLS